MKRHRFAWAVAGLLGMTFYFNNTTNSGFVYVNRADHNAIVIDNGKNSCSIISPVIGTHSIKCNEFYDGFKESFNGGAVVAIITPVPSHSPGR